MHESTREGVSPRRSDLEEDARALESRRHKKMSKNGENVYEEVVEENPYEKPDTPEPKYENQGAIYENPAEAKEAIYSEVEVHVERSSPDYINTRSGKEDDSSSSSSSEDEEEKTLEQEEALPMEVNGEADNSRRSSSSSSSDSGGDPCDDPPRSPVHEDNVEDGLLMAYERPDDSSPEPEEIVDYSLKTVESSAVEETKVADPNVPDIALFVKVGLSKKRKKNSEILKFKFMHNTVSLKVVEVWQQAR